MVSIPPNMAFPNKGFGKAGAELMREVKSGVVVGVDVGVARDEKRRGFEEDDIVRREEFRQVSVNVCLYLSGFVRSLLSSVFCLSGVVGERVDDDRIVFVKSHLSNLV